MAAPASAALVRTRHTEGSTHAIFRVTDVADQPIADGEVIQFEEGRGVISSRLRIRFNDGSLYDEVVRFSQRPVLRLLSYKLEQRGPSFEESEISFDRTGRYSARVRTSGGKEETDAGTTSIPEDVSNGMTSTILKNLPAGTSGATHLMAFTPKPQVLELELAPEGEDRFAVGTAFGKAKRFLMTPTVPGLKGALVSLVGKQPPTFRMWLTPEPAPALLKFEGPLYADGPTWRIMPTTPRWK